MKLDNESGYFERLIFTEIAKTKDKYKALGYEVYEEYPIKIEGKFIHYDLMVEKNQHQIFFEFKTGNFSSTSNDILNRKRITKKHFPNAEFRLVVVQLKEKPKTKIEGFEKLLENVVRYDIKNVKEYYSNFLKLINIEECNIVNFNWSSQVLSISGNSYLKGSFRVKSEDFEGVLTDTIPFSFAIHLKKIFYLTPIHFSFSLLELTQNDINSSIENKSITYEIDYAFYNYGKKPD